jgi:hypothetical protein
LRLENNARKAVLQLRQRGLSADIARRNGALRICFPEPIVIDSGQALIVV